MAGKIYIFSGAGISAPSGISTFRDKDGLWDNHKIEEICDIRTWLNNYDKVHKFYNERRTSLKNVEPNKVHYKIAEWQKKYGKENVINITQNIDDLFERANVENTIHVHGELVKMECKTCNHIYEIGYEEFKNDSSCPECHKNYVKPFVVFFYENAPEYHWAKRLLNSIETGDVLLVIGTMGNVFPIEMYMKYIKHSNRQRPLFILNNMERSTFIPESYFGDNIFYESCVDSIDKIDLLINDYLKK